MSAHTYPRSAPVVAGGALKPPPQVSPATYSIPVPPSVNELFFNKPGKGRVKTRLYDDWLGHAAWVLKAQRPVKIGGRVVIVLSVERSSAQADIDNRVKAIFDLLVSQKVIDDDSNVVGFCVAWAPAASKQARVMILPADNYSFSFHLASDGATGGWFLDAPQQEQA
jgi:Holliday junction resolvase RusA-like endonuclease